MISFANFHQIGESVVMPLRLFDTIFVGLVRLVVNSVVIRLCHLVILKNPVELGFFAKPINIILYLNNIFNKLLYNINLINLVIKFYDIVLIYIYIY